MTTIYDASQTPTTLKGLAEHIRVVLRRGDTVDTYLPVFRETRSGSYEPKELSVYVTDYPTHGVVRNQFRVVKGRPNGIEMYYKDEVNEEGHLSILGLKQALKDLGVRMTKPEKASTRRSPPRAPRHMR